MLNFTYESDLCNGQYNGRFVFRAPLRLDALKDDDMRAIANAHPDALADTALRHEFIHWQVFRHSAVGRSLVGKRYRTRFQFQRGRREDVTVYYAQRTAYFMASYSTHEALVHSLEAALGARTTLAELQSLALDVGMVEQVTGCDRRALALCERLGLPYGAAERALDSIRGGLATREFGVQAYMLDAAGRPRLHEVSLKGRTHGIFNATTETRYSKAPLGVRLLRQLVRVANPERWFEGALSPENLARWAFLKFRTELPILRSMGIECPGFDTDVYVNNSIRFITAYTGHSMNPLTRRLVFHLLLSTADREVDEQAVIGKLALLDRDFLYFFYAHGN